MKKSMLFPMFFRPALIAVIMLFCTLFFNTGTGAAACTDPEGAFDIMGWDVTFHENDTIRVPVAARNAFKPEPANQVKALGFDILFDATVLEFVEFELGELLAQFTMTGCNGAYAEGVIRIGGFTVDAPLGDPIEPDEEGILGYLVFTYLSAPQCTVLTPANLVDHIAAWSAPAGYLLPGSPPTADAGQDSAVSENEAAALDGSASSDPDDDIRTYLWEQIDGVAVVLSDTGAVQPTFTVPPGTAGQTLTFQLTVTDGSGNSDTDTVVVTVSETGCTSFPDKPELVAPEDGAENISLAPTLTAGDYSDPGACSTHWKTRWQISKQNDFSGLIYNANTIGQNLTEHQVTKMVLEPDTTYYWRVRYWGDNGLKSEWSEVFSFTTRTDTRDGNANGIPDSQEADGDTDINENDIPDIAEADLRSLLTSGGNAIIGVEIPDSVLSITVETMDEQEIGDTENRPDDFPYGLIAFRAAVAAPGLTVAITVYLEEAAPDEAVWYKYDTVNGWYSFCPQVIFREDRKALVLLLTDGGIGDADGVANGIIVDPSGLGVYDEETPLLPGGASAGCFIGTSISAP